MRGSLYIANKNSPTVQNRPPLSEGQKGLLMFAYLRLQTPGLLIFDEPTNHINFRHIPAIIDAIKNYEGPVIVVSHVNDFVRQIGITKTLDLGKLV